MSREGEVAARQVWKRFRPDQKHKRLSHYLRAMPERMRGVRPGWLWALRDISFEVEPGEAVGLVGANGSGKSTLLKILNQVMYPYAGSVETTGRIGALIEVSSGLHPELSGQENVFLYGSLLGLKRREVAARFDRIIEFAGLEDAVERQVKFYSSGMRTRLGFAVAAFLEPAILLVDEVLAVGDASFQQRCLDRMSEVHAQGTTIIYVSHDLPTVEATCSRAIWLHHGQMLSDGPVREVLGEYRRSVEEQVELAPVAGLLQVDKVEVSGPGGRSAQTAGPLDVSLVLTAPRSMAVDVHLGVTEGPGTPVVLVTHRAELQEGPTELRCRIDALPVPRGRYYAWCAVSSTRGHSVLPWGPIAHFEVGGPTLSTSPRGVVRLGPIYVDAEWETGAPSGPAASRAATDR
jgi:ABC-type polysaccharide/polyol phosphate transport system ATPase subunit